MADALQGAAGGAAAGSSVAGPYGALVGGVLGATGLLGGDKKTSGSGAASAPPISTTQTNRQDVSTDLDISNNLIGAPININIGGQQQADASLGAGQKYTDRGVDEPGLNAPFGTLQDVRSTPVNALTDFFSSGSIAPKPSHAPMFLWIGGGLILAGATLAVLRQQHG